MDLNLISNILIYIGGIMVLSGIFERILYRGIRRGFWIRLTFVAILWLGICIKIFWNK